MNSAVIKVIKKSNPLAVAVLVITACALLLFVDVEQHSYAQSNSARSNVPEPNWIWAPIKRSANRAAGICYFRKPFVIRTASGGQIDIACDGQFVLYVNGIKVASGSGWKQDRRYQIGPYLERGRNVVAIEAVKSEPGPAGLLATITLFGPNNEQFHMATNQTWKTSLEKKSSWQQAEFIENGWLAAHVVATTKDDHFWNQEQQNPSAKEKPSRFKVTREFRVEWVVRPEDSGSLIAISFDEFGNIIASQEGGALLLIRDADKDGIPERVTNYCDEVKNCQGILAMNGKVLVTADGPDGCGLYELADTDRDGVVDNIELLIPFQGKMQEHGPHGLRLGPDGMIYLIAGNLDSLDAEIHENSPYRNFYEGDLVQPRHEDPRGHAIGVKAPGATVYRIDPDGNRVERFAAGLRNPYDIAFNSSGDLFTWDADMEWDESTPWYRPTRINHVVASGEYGWRSGWAKWPDYFLDSLPGIGSTGNGSPTGMVFYDHYMFPSRYHNTLFVGDWAQGQILAITLKRQGSSYTTDTSVFLDGNPLNVTDMEVGPDGLLYFCTGGRGTEGGIYRVKWTGKVPPEVKDRGTGLEMALRQPQMQTAWSRQRVALIKRDLGDRWDEQILAMVRDRSVPVARRTRALDLMQLYGPQPSTRLLIQLSSDRERWVRSKAAFLLGIHSNSQAIKRLSEMVDDPNMVVQRTACEALVRIGTDDLPIDSLVKLLGHSDRHLAYAAAKALQTLPIEQWKTLVAKSKDQRTFLVGSAAILGTYPDQDVCFEILRQLQTLMKDFVADREFIDLLRVVQLALHQGEIDAESVPDLTRQMSKEFPSGNAVINRELVRILAYLESPFVADRYLEYMKSNLEIEDLTHLSAHTPHFINSWSTDQRFEVLKLMGDVRNEAGSPSHAHYIDNVARIYVSRLTASERVVVLDQGEKWPGAAMGAIAKLPVKLDAQTLDKLISLDEALAGRDDDPASHLRIGITAVLARSGKENALAYLRELYENEPERRGILAVGLAQHPEGKNWPLLIRSLTVLEGGMAVDVLTRLSAVQRVEDDPESIRQVILQGLRQNQNIGRRRAIQLLEKWTGTYVGDSDDSPQNTLVAWQDWFGEQYPHLPQAELPQEDDGDRYTISELEKYLTSDEATAADAAHGRLVYSQAQCIKCHRFGNVGERIGPDLTTISKRFQKKELLQSIVFPSHVISDQYATKTVATTDGRIHTGIVQVNNDGSVLVIDTEGKQLEVAADNIEEIVPSNQSSMPSGLLNSLTLQEIADLFAFLSESPQSNVSRLPER